MLIIPRHSPSISTLQAPRSPGPLPAPWARLILDLAVNIPREATRPDLLVGMGLGGLFYQGGRALGLKALLSAGGRGPVAALMARGAGLASETSGFILASRGVTRGLGQGGSQDFSQLGREWLSLAMFLGTMRAAHGVLRLGYGPQWQPENLLKSLQYGASHQATTFAAVAGMAAAEWKLGWRNYQDPVQLLTESAALMLTFQWGGRLAHHAFGSRLAPLERALETRTRGREKNSPAPDILPVGLGALAGVRAGTGEVPGAGLVFAVKGGGGEGPPRRRRRSAPRTPRHSGSFINPFRAIGPGEMVRIVNDPNSAFLNQILKQDVLFRLEGTLDNKATLDPIVRAINKVTQSYQKGEGKNPLLPGRAVIIQLDPTLNPSLPKELLIRYGKDGFFLAPILPEAEGRTIPPSSEAEKADAGVDELLIASAFAEKPGQGTEFRGRMESLLGNLDQPLLPIRTRSFLEFGRKVRQDPEEFLEGLVTRDRVVELEIPLGFSMDLALKALNGLKGVEGLPEGRRVAFQWEEQENPQVAVKRGESFVAAMGTVRDPDPVSSRERTGGDSATGTLWKAGHLPPTFEDLKFLPVYMRQAVQEDYPGFAPRLILEGNQSIDLAQLENATPDKLLGIEEGASWELLVPQNSGPERNFSALLQGEKINWRVGALTTVARAEGQIHFAHRRVTDAAEIYLQLEAQARLKEVTPAPTVIFQHGGELSPEYAEALGNFVRTALHRYQVEAERFEVQDEAGKMVLSFWNKNSIWYYSRPIPTERPAG